MGVPSKKGKGIVEDGVSFIRQAHPEASPCAGAVMGHGLIVKAKRILWNTAQSEDQERNDAHEDCQDDGHNETRP